MFTFDSDYDLGIILFEQAMPVLASANADEDNLGRSTDHVLLGELISNTLYIKPTVTHSLREDLLVQVSLLAAKTAKLPEEYAGRASYGMELDAGLSFQANERLTTQATLAAFFPGSWFKEYSDDTLFDLDDPVLGLELLASFEF